MIEKINKEIKIMSDWYESTGRIDDMTYIKIKGMVEMLQIVTGKDYIITKAGLIER